MLWVTKEKPDSVQLVSPISPHAEEIIGGVDRGVTVQAQNSIIESKVLQCLDDKFGMTGSLRRLSGENINYLFETSAGEHHVVKIVDEDMPSAVVEMENSVIDYAATEHFPYELPQIIRNKKAQIETRIILRENVTERLRMLSFIAGKQFSSLSDISNNLYIELGKMLASFNLIMESFDHPVAHRNHRWNLAEAGQHADKVTIFDSQEQRKVLTWAFDFWATKARNNFSRLPHQIIHGDAHGENILVANGQISGLVDFGDCCFNPTACELGVALPYVMTDRDDPFETVRLVISGYQSIRPLSSLERSVIMPLICGRLAVSLCVAEERRRIDPGRHSWFSGADQTWRLLKKIFESSELLDSASIL